MAKLRPNIGEWNYSGDPSSTKAWKAAYTVGDRDTVRFLFGDTDQDDPQVGDGEIKAALDAEPSVIAAAALCAEMLAAYYGRRTTKSINAVTGTGIVDNLSDLTDHYAAIAQRLRARAAISIGAGVYAGGISEADKLAHDLDSDRVRPDFREGMFDSPFARPAKPIGAAPGPANIPPLDDLDP